MGRGERRLPPGHVHSVFEHTVVFVVVPDQCEDLADEDGQVREFPLSFL